MATWFNWFRHGFGAPPLRTVAGPNGTFVYRCWGGRSHEMGSGYFSLDRPRSVVDAELRFNIVDWGNGVRHLSTFRLKPGTPHWVGPVAHGAQDLRAPARQVYVEPHFKDGIELWCSKSLLQRDRIVVLRAGNA